MSVIAFQCASTVLLPHGKQGTDLALEKAWSSAGATESTSTGTSIQM